MSIPFAWIVSLTIFAIAILLSPHFPICSDIIRLSTFQSGKHFHPLDYLKMLKHLHDCFCLSFRRMFPRLIFLRPSAITSNDILSSPSQNSTFTLITLSGDLWDKSTTVSTCTVCGNMSQGLTHLSS